MTETHCQICGRPIKAKHGKIAHHGYKRPRRYAGWQTSSCSGARYEPYEKSRDRIAEVIVFIKEYIVDQQAWLDGEPPTKLGYENYIGSSRYETLWVEKPVGFIVETGRSYFSRNSYAGLYDRAVTDHNTAINNSKKHIEQLQERYDQWQLK